MDISPLTRSYRRGITGVGVLAMLLAVLGTIVTNSYYLSSMTNTVIYAIAALGLFLLFGMAGQISFGQAAFFGIGAYTAAVLVLRTGCPPLLALVAAVLLSTAVGWVVARPLLRLSGHSLAMASLAFGVVMTILFGQLRSITGGMDPGISISAFSVFGVPMGSVKWMYGISALFLVLATWVIVNLLHSRHGRALRALKTSETAARGAAIATARYKTMAFSIAAGLAGLAGALFAFSLRSFNATAFSFDLSIELVIVVIIGSVRSVWGALFGAVLVSTLPTLLEAFNDYKLLVYGLAMALIMMFMPQGLVHGIFSLRHRFMKSAVRP